MRRFFILFARLTVFENKRKKVSFNIASEASYVYILSGQKFIQKCQKYSILASFWKPEACGQTVLPDRSVLIGQKLVQNAKIQMRHFGQFSNDVYISMYKNVWIEIKISLCLSWSTCSMMLSEACQSKLCATWHLIHSVFV